jgi:hypothetical protein
MRIIHHILNHYDDLNSPIALASEGTVNIALRWLCDRWLRHMNIMKQITLLPLVEIIIPNRLQLQLNKNHLISYFMNGYAECNTIY